MPRGIILDSLTRYVFPFGTPHPPNSKNLVPLPREGKVVITLHFSKEVYIMKTKKVISLLLIFCIAFSGCSIFKPEPSPAPLPEVIEEEGALSPIVIEPIEPEPQPEPEPVPEPEPEPEPLPENDIASLDELSPYFHEFENLGYEQVPWGPGTNFNKEGTPIACVGLQSDYGKWACDFYREGAEHENKVYLTFDEGYENGYTSVILDVLKEKGVSAVFFITLPYAKSQPELIQRMIDEGHVLGNHSARHPNMTKINMEEAYAEVADLHNYVSENFGYDMYLFRPPEGAFSERTLALLQKMNYRTVCWSFAYADWDPEKQPENQSAFDRITKSPHDGAVYLLHAVSKTNAEVLGDVIDDIRAKGYSFEKYV